MKLGIASDHGGFELKTAIIQQLSRFEFVDLGASNAERVDYPLFADKLCQVHSSTWYPIFENQSIGHYQ